MPIVEIRKTLTNMHEKIVEKPEEMEEKTHDLILFAQWFAEQFDLFMIIMESTTRKVLEGDIVNPLTTLWRLIDSSSMLWHNL